MTNAIERLGKLEQRVHTLEQTGIQLVNDYLTKYGLQLRDGEKNPEELAAATGELIAEKSYQKILEICQEFASSEDWTDFKKAYIGLRFENPKKQEFNGFPHSQLGDSKLEIQLASCSYRPSIGILADATECDISQSYNRFLVGTLKDESNNILLAIALSKPSEGPNRAYERLCEQGEELMKDALHVIFQQMISDGIDPIKDYENNAKVISNPGRIGTALRTYTNLFPENEVADNFVATVMEQHPVVANFY